MEKGNYDEMSVFIIGLLCGETQTSNQTSSIRHDRMALCVQTLLENEHLNENPNVAFFS